MRLIVVEDAAAISRIGADLVAATIEALPTATIVPATGESPMGVYQELGARVARGDLDASRLHVFQLDAYLGLASDDRRSLYAWLQRSFLEPLGIDERRMVRLPGDAVDPAAVCHAYDDAVRLAGGIDLSILGLGPNGHIGFNEPPSAPDAPTRVVDLTQASLESNARYWGDLDLVPRRALTAGMNVLLKARTTLLVVAGTRKQAILRAMLTESPTPDLPASFLRQADNVTVLADRAAWPWPVPSALLSSP